MVAGFRITIPEAPIRAFLCGVAGADVVQEMVANDDGGNGCAPSTAVRSELTAIS